MLCEAYPLELLHARQSLTVAPAGREAVAQVMHLLPIMTLPAGQRHRPEGIFHIKPLVQTHPKLFARPFDITAYLQSVQRPFAIA